MRISNKANAFNGHYCLVCSKKLTGHQLEFCCEEHSIDYFSFIKNRYHYKAATKVLENMARLTIDDSRVPCILIRGKYEGERCKASYKCEHYLQCLDLAAKCAWRGWSSKRRKE